MSILKRVFLSLGILSVAAGNVLAADDGGSPLFKRARDFYAAGQYDSTIVIIREHLRRNGRDPESLTLVPLISEAYIRKGEYTQFRRLADMYRQKFPEAPFTARLYYLDGMAYAKEEKHTQALMAFSRALETGVSAELFNLTLSNTEHVCGRTLSVEELSSLSNKAELHGAMLEIVRFWEVRKLASAGQVVRAQNGAEEFRKLYPRSRYIEQIKDLFVRNKEQKRSAAVQVGMLAPLSGDNADIGKMVLQGAKLAFDNYNSRTQNPLKLIVYDTKGSPVETARRSKDLMLKDQAPLCIGPVLSNTATVSAAMFADKDIVMISPTANENGISSIGDNIFQMNVTVGSIAQKLARYSLDNLNIREFAIIAPANSFGFAMSEAFKEELGRRNIEVVFEEYFSDGMHDFSPILRQLRHMLLCRHLEKLAADRGNLQKITQISRADSIRYADSTLAVGGLFMPLSADDVVKLAPQAVFHRIRTQMLGAGGWNDKSVPREGKRYVNNAIIATGFQPDYTTAVWNEFDAAYKAHYNEEPNSIAALGYDAAKLVIKAVEETGGTDAAKLKKALSGVNGYSGLSGIISFDPATGSNSEAIIMKITESGFLRVQ
ncbi:MAG: ABC transporter substrate-binding protein [Chitinispirillales bacterium]|jgi:ABC-type branched-subunit amino acid transport system substrate-binding protein|nr:ABC transporter substrate-binding protein [Chitinispirillales bacterium]